MNQSAVEVEMLHAVFVRTLRPGVTYEQFKDAWMPEHVEGNYPARPSVGRNESNDRQVITILELDVSAEEFAAGRPGAARGDRGDDGAGRRVRRRLRPVVVPRGMTGPTAVRRSLW